MVYLIYLKILQKDFTSSVMIICRYCFYQRFWCISILKKGFWLCVTFLKDVWVTGDYDWISATYKLWHSGWRRTPGKRSSPGTRCPGHSGPNRRQGKENFDSKNYLFIYNGNFNELTSGTIINSCLNWISANILGFPRSLFIWVVLGCIWNENIELSLIFNELNKVDLWS